MALVAMSAAVLVCAASAQARGLRPGLRSAAPSQRALSQALAQTTGLSTSQVTSVDICPPAARGQARCAGQALILRSSRALVRPHTPRHATLGRVKPAFTPGFATPATASATTPPLPGTPAYLQQAYDLTYLSQSRGTGDTIAVVDPFSNPNAEPDLATYRAKYGLPACTTSNGCFRKVNQTGGTTPPSTHDATWAMEESLDLDAVSALCPNCHILLVEANSGAAGDLDTAQITAASLGANQISDSWTFAVSGGFLGGRYVFSGVSTVAATGDTGYLGTNTDNFPAAFSGVTAAGGTSLAPAGGGDPRGFSEGAWSLNGKVGGSSGCDLNVGKPSYQIDTGCSQKVNGQTFGRAYADLSADSDPATGLSFYDSEKGGWGVIGGTSLAAPLIAAYYAIIGVQASSTPGWAYNNSSRLNDPTTGSSGTCTSDISYICNAGPGYDGPTGVGSISGAAVTGAPGIGGPANVSGSTSSYTQSTRTHGATLEGGIYPNAVDTKWWIEYGTRTSYGQQTPATDAGSGTSPVAVTGYLSRLAAGTTYHYRLVAQNFLGTTYGYDYTFTTPASTPTDPTASFAAPATAVPNGATPFDASGSIDSGASITDYTWNFGDGRIKDTGTSAQTTHRFAAPGTYNVTLIVTNSSGQKDSMSQLITIDNPQAAFTAPQIVAPGSPASFNGSGSTDSLHAIADYSWNFGDGTTHDTGTTPTDSHTYANRGTYTVTLTLTTSFGQTATTTHTVTVDTPPTAAFTPPGGAQTPGSPLGFDASGSTAASGGSIADYSWNFGDGSGTMDAGASPTESHSYPNPGHYTATLTVTDDLGLTSTTTHNITVDQPHASFTGPSTFVAPNSPASFDASNSSDAVGTITDYSWNFGDGTTDDTGTTPTDTHTYANRGRYTVTLTVSNDAGQTSTTHHDVIADLAPTAAFSPSATVSTPNSPLGFDATASTPGAGGTIADYSWDFGDGSGTTDVGASATTTHAYATPGHYTATLTITDDLGLTSTTTHTLTVDAAPAASFSASTDHTDLSLGFDAGSSADSVGTITDYSWDFGDGTPVDDTTTTPTDTHTYATRGTYTVTLTVTNDAGQTSTTQHDVTADIGPTASLAAPAGAQASGSQVDFNASGSTPGAGGTIADYSWNFGDGTPVDDTTTTPTDTHTYANSGHYTATLTVTDDLGITSTTTQPVTVDAAPTASFSASTDHTDLAVAFDAGNSGDALGTITGYSWNFGDGTPVDDTGTTATDSHTYASRGTYTVTLTVTNDAGQASTTYHHVTADIAPTAAFSPSTTVTTPNSPLGFDATASTPGLNGTITDYSWDFGDGSGTTNVGASPTTTHTYANPGHYTATLTITDDLEINSTTTQQVTVDQPHASFTGPTTFVAPNSAASFDASGSTDPAGTITDYNWDFGDDNGNTVDAGSSATTTHSYTHRGAYHVTLTVTNGDRQTDTAAAQTVIVDTAPTAAFSPPAGAQQPNSPVSFDSSASAPAAGGSIRNYSWNFGDGRTGTGSDPHHSYSSPGHYTVTLKVTDDLGMTSTTTTHSVTVDAAPSASFSTSPNPASLGPAVVFDARGSGDSLGTITGYSWDFGDGSSGSGATAPHAYRTPGHYTVTLTVTNDAGQTATVNHAITVDAAPSPSFSVSPSAARTGAPVSFNAGSSSDAVGTIAAYTWHFGDGASASGLSASHAYANPGSYMVALTVTNDAGQSATSTQTVTVYAAPAASFSVSPATTLPGAAVNFSAAASSDPGGAITGYSWNFGDGAAANGPSPSHAYAKPGTYTVTLTVIGSLGLASSTSHTVTVNPTPLNARLSAHGRQTLATVLKHGVGVSVFTNTPARASFVVTMPAPTAKQKRKHGKRVAKPRASTLLRTGSLGFATGAHLAAFKLSRATAAKVRAAGKPVVLTVRMTLTDVYGRKTVRSIKVTVTR